MTEIFGANEALYSAYNTCFNIDSMSKPGNWNSDLGDLFPVAAANVLECTINIYSSHASHITPITINPTKNMEKTGLPTINLAHININGHEHYNPCVLVDNIYNVQVAFSEVDQPGTSSSTNDNTAVDDPPPMKKAKKESLKDEKKRLRNSGKIYFNSNGKKVDKRKPSLINCKCRNECKSISTDEQDDICRNFWEMGDQNQRTLYIVSNVDEIQRNLNCQCTMQGQKKVNRKFYLPLVRNGVSTRIQVCKETFLKTLCIGNKTIQYNL